MNSPDYAQAILNSALPHKAQLAQLVRPAVFARSRPVFHEKPPVGASRLGGLPDLPPGIQWPVWQGKPQSFVAQINLSELSEFSERHLLPPQGWLFFFYDSARSTSGLYRSERESFKVIYTTEPVHEMESRPAPDGLGQVALFHPVFLSFSVGNSEPGWEHPALERLGLSFEQCLVYAEVIHCTRQDTAETEAARHQILGYPSPMQAPVALDCEHAQRDYWKLDRVQQAALRPLIREHVDDWELLLQVDCDPDAKIDWPGSGRVYYMIRRQDLVQRAFDRAWFVLQST